MDIIETSEGSQTGYLAVDALDYAHCIASILYNSNEENEAIRNAARYMLSILNLGYLKSHHIYNPILFFFTEPLAIDFPKKNSKETSYGRLHPYLMTEPI